MDDGGSPRPCVSLDEVEIPIGRIEGDATELVLAAPQLGRSPCRVGEYLPRLLPLFDAHNEILGIVEDDLTEAGITDPAAWLIVTVAVEILFVPDCTDR